MIIAVVSAFSSAFEASAEARNWRLNPDESAKADFVSIKAAMEDERVQPGDILVLDPGYYNEWTSITKDNISICGSGYMLSQNFDYSETASAIVRELTIEANDVKIIGCHLNGLKASATHVNTSLFRCLIEYMYGSDAYSLNTKKMSVEECFIKWFKNICFTNCTFKNNIIAQKYGNQLSGDTSNACTIEYNTIICDHSDVGRFINSIFKDNIIINKGEVGTIRIDTSDNNQFNNNVFSIPAEKADRNYPNNKYVGATVENTFVDEIIADRYFIREGNIALKAASDGGQCGAFGGRSPYVLSGIPDYTPHITEVQIPAKPTDNKLNVKLKIAIRDE